MNVIVCLIGPSGSGKTTIARMLEAEYNVIHSYTTRPPREPGEWGHNFIAEPWQTFEDRKGRWVRFYRDGKPEIQWRQVIAYTVYDGAAYFGLPEQYRGKGTSIYIVDPSGVESLRREVTDARVAAVYLAVDGDERWQRLMRKGEIAHKRMARGDEIFSLVPCDYCIDANGTPEDTLALVKKVIGRVTGY